MLWTPSFLPKQPRGKVPRDVPVPVTAGVRDEGTGSMWTDTARQGGRAPTWEESCGPGLGRGHQKPQVRKKKKKGDLGGGAGTGMAGWGGRRAGRGDQKRWASNLATPSHQPPQISPLCLARGTGLQTRAGGAPRGQAGSGEHPQHPSARPPGDAHRPPNPGLHGGVAGTRGTKERPWGEKGGQEPWPPPRGGFTGC